MAKKRRKSRLSAEDYRKRLLERIQALVEVCPEKGCWLFKGTKWNNYGRIDVRGRMVKAHHATYYALRGRWPAKKGKVWLHGCDTPACCNFSHGKWGSTLANNRDRHRKGRSVMPDAEAAARGRQKALETRALRRQLTRAEDSTADDTRRRIGKEDSLNSDVMPDSSLHGGEHNIVVIPRQHPDSPGCADP
jgi:hypothetical protein